jgi:serine/threonine protein kinase
LYLLSRRAHTRLLYCTRFTNILAWLRTAPALPFLRCAHAHASRNRSSLASSCTAAPRDAWLQTQEQKHPLTFATTTTHTQRAQVPLRDSDEGIPATSLREISLLKMMDHPNVVALVDVVFNTQAAQLYLVMEYAENDMKRFIDNHDKKLSAEMVKWYVARFLSRMHPWHLCTHHPQNSRFTTTNYHNATGSCGRWFPACTTATRTACCTAT